MTIEIFYVYLRFHPIILPLQRKYQDHELNIQMFHHLINLPIRELYNQSLFIEHNEVCLFY